MRRPSWSYRLLFLALGPAILTHAAWLAVKGAGLRYFLERTGLKIPAGESGPIWVHAASVGEVNAAAPLIRALRSRMPEQPVLLTTTTPTGAAQAARSLPDIPHRYLPLDFRFAVARVLDRLRPRCLLVMETEIWPRLYFGCAQRGIPLLIVNARLSPRTVGRPPWMRRTLRTALQNVTAVLARSEEDRRLYIALGADGVSTVTVGNIKFTQPDTPADPLALPRPYLLAASTHQDEELRLARVWMALPFTRSHLLVIAPRHPNRRDAILEQLATAGARVAVRSRGDAVTEATDIYLADTLGELRGFIAGAAAVFVGGSLVPRGGQNLLEVAAAGRAPIYGPSIYNFQAEHDLLQSRQAAFVVENERALSSFLARALSDDELLEAAGRRARRVIDDQRGIAERYAEAIIRRCSV